MKTTTTPATPDLIKISVQEFIDRTMDLLSPVLGKKYSKMGEYYREVFVLVEKRMQEYGLEYNAGQIFSKKISNALPLFYIKVSDFEKDNRVKYGSSGRVNAISITTTQEFDGSKTMTDYFRHVKTIHLQDCIKNCESRAAEKQKEFEEAQDTLTEAKDELWHFENDVKF